MKILDVLFIMLLSICMPATVWADEYPTANPKMTVDTGTGPEEATDYSGSAPIVAHFTANPENLGAYTPIYTWTITLSETGDTEVVRHDADMDFTFTKSTTYNISLTAVFVNGTDTIDYAQPTAFTITPNPSSLNVPNAFSPNGDGCNDIFRVKQEGYMSIVNFHGYIFNRWGKKLFEWTDITKGWDGRFGGNPVADGVYFCRIDAQGADGKKYHIKKAIHVLRKHIEEEGTTND